MFNRGHVETPRSRECGTDPTLSHPAASPKRQAVPPGTRHWHPPTLPGDRSRSQPALHGGGAALSPAGALPAERHRSCHFSNSARSCHPSAHVPYLSVSVLRAFPPLARAVGKHRDGSPRDNLKYFRVVPAELSLP